MGERVESVQDNLFTEGQCMAASDYLKLEVLGPYGSCLGDTDPHEHLVLIGTGTGVSPLISLFFRYPYP